MNYDNFDVPAAIADREEWIELLGASPSLEQLKTVGLSSYNWTQIAAGRNPRIPLACFKLAQFQRHGQLTELLGSTWAEFEIRDRKLTFPGLRQPLEATEVRATWISIQELGRLRAENKMLRRDIEKLDERLEMSEQLAEQYRSMILLEAHTGMMLCRINE